MPGSVKYKESFNPLFRVLSIVSFVCVLYSEISLLIFEILGIFNFCPILMPFFASGFNLNNSSTEILYLFDNEYNVSSGFIVYKK